MADRFDSIRPRSYRLEYETPEGETRQSIPMTYRQTEDQQELLESGGNRILGVVKNQIESEN